MYTRVREAGKQRAAQASQNPDPQPLKLSMDLTESFQVLGFEASQQLADGNRQHPGTTDVIQAHDRLLRQIEERDPERQNKAWQLNQAKHVILASIKQR